MPPAKIGKGCTYGVVLKPVEGYEIPQLSEILRSAGLYVYSGRLVKNGSLVFHVNGSWLADDRDALTQLVGGLVGVLEVTRVWKHGS